MDDADRMILRSAWQTATLIAGDPGAGRAVVAELLAQATDPKRINESLAYRAAIAISSERPHDPTTTPTLVPGDGPLYAQPVRERAAWLIARVLDEPIATACRATGMETPDAEAAIASLDDALPHDLPARLRERIAHFDTQTEINAATRQAAPRRQRRKWLALAQLLLLFICFGLMIFVMLDLLAWDDREAELREEALRYSNPMPEGTEREPIRTRPSQE